MFRRTARSTARRRGRTRSTSGCSSRREKRAQWENDQRGSGYFALCDKCNNERGGKWHVPEFQEWAHVGADIVQEVQQHPQYDDLVAVNLTMRRSYPVRFVKQVVLMLLAINPAEFAAAHEPFRAFVLGREAQGLPGRVSPLSRAL